MIAGTPLISVIVPVYNGASLLPEALQSIFAQGYPRLETLVVDDGSTDDPAAVVCQYGTAARLLRQDHQGAPHARNFGLAEARGEIIAFLDADDLYAPDKFHHQLPRLDTAEVVIGYSCLLDRDAPPWLFLNLGSALFRRSIFDRVGRFDQSLAQSDDLDWFMRAREAGIPMRVHDEVVLRHRRHAQNLTNDRGRTDYYNLLMLKRAAARRRGTKETVPSFTSLREGSRPAPDGHEG